MGKRGTRLAQARLDVHNVVAGNGFSRSGINEIPCHSAIRSLFGEFCQWALLGL